MFLFAKIIIDSACMVIEYFATVATDIFSNLFSTAYRSSISNNIAFTSKTIKFTILI